jgi:hypothetical protein
MLVPFFFVIRYGVIAREETYLDRKFGAVYLDYKSCVRRWLSGEVHKSSRACENSGPQRFWRSYFSLALKFCHWPGIGLDNAALEKSHSLRKCWRRVFTRSARLSVMALGQLTIQADLRPARSELYRCGPPVHVSALSKGEDQRDAHKQDEGNAE